VSVMLARTARISSARSPVEDVVEEEEEEEEGGEWGRRGGKRRSKRDTIVDGGRRVPRRQPEEYSSSTFQGLIAVERRRARRDGEMCRTSGVALLPGEGKWPRYKFYCSFAARNCERVTAGN